MDPFSADNELANLQNTFHQGQFKEVLDYQISDLSPEHKSQAKVLALRAQIALGNVDEVWEKVKDETEPDLVALRAFIQVMKGDEAEAVTTIQDLGRVEGPALVLAALVMHRAGKSDAALDILGAHQGDLEAVAITVQIHLQQNRTDLAIKEVAAARRWAQDSLLVNLAESWVGLRMGGKDYQKAFYVFEELAQAPSSSSSQSLVSQAVTEIHLGRLEEAEAALQRVLSTDPNNLEALANSIVLNVISGRDTTELSSKLELSAPNYLSLQDLREKESLFEKAASKYTASVAAL
ncbi:unnamed protein product [Blumeria hordei]|uniref:Coatomer subunit epsilon n=2 Tax=Blumeria hordei TaxID=2867405 RepID=A0A383UR45_BLUHO|nr:coatomer subunit epsilon [Blumeria hordei DH14]SZF02804.1 unnamed protein product [Blumeria hordei]